MRCISLIEINADPAPPDPLSYEHSPERRRQLLAAAEHANSMAAGELVPSSCHSDCWTPWLWPDTLLQVLQLHTPKLRALRTRCVPGVAVTVGAWRREALSRSSQHVLLMCVGHDAYALIYGR